MVIICTQYKNGNCQVLNMRGKNYNTVIDGKCGVTCPDTGHKMFCGWYLITNND